MDKQQYIELHKNMFWYTPADKKREKRIYTIK